MRDNLPNSCRLCLGSFCGKCLEPGKHQCQFLVRLGKNWIDPSLNRLDYNCSDCGQNLVKSNYSNEFSEDFKELAELKSKIKEELEATIQSEYNKKMGDLYLCFSQGEGEEYYWQYIRAKYSRDLLNLEHTIWKKIVENHQEIECGRKIENKSSSLMNRSKKSCGFPKCRQAGIRIKCSRCKTEFCTKHLLPEVHLCHSIKIFSTPSQAITCK